MSVQICYVIFNVASNAWFNISFDIFAFDS